MHTHHDTTRGLLPSLASSIEPPSAGRRARRKIDGASNRAELDALLAELAAVGIEATTVAALLVHRKARRKAAPARLRQCPP